MLLILPLVMFRFFAYLYLNGYSVFESSPFVPRPPVRYAPPSYEHGSLHAKSLCKKHGTFLWAVQIICTDWAGGGGHKRIRSVFWDSFPVVLLESWCKIEEVVESAGNRSIAAHLSHFKVPSLKLEGHNVSPQQQRWIQNNECCQRDYTMSNWNSTTIT